MGNDRTDHALLGAGCRCADLPPRVSVHLLRRLAILSVSVLFVCDAVDYRLWRLHSDVSATSGLMLKILVSIHCNNNCVWFQERVFGIYFKFYQAFIILWFVFGLSYLLMLIAFIAR